MIVLFRAHSVDEIRTGIKIDAPIRKGKPHQGTVNDLRMGAYETGQRCETCGENGLRCPGHFGYIDLPEPCFNPSYSEAVINILHCVCWECRAPRIDLLPEERISFSEYVGRAKYASRCGECGKSLPKFSFSKSSENPGYFVPMVQASFEKGTKKSTVLSAVEVLAVFEAISYESLEVIGFNHHIAYLVNEIKPLHKLDTHGRPSLYHFRPEDLITQAIPVVPTTARPRVQVGPDLRYDDLTEAYNKIVKLVTQASSQERLTPESRKKYDDAVRRIQSEYWRLSAPAPKNGKSTGVRSVKSLSDRIGGKDGRKTSNVAGKRADFTSRTVASPGGSEIKFGSLGYPRVFAEKLTQPEPVVGWNIVWLTGLLEQGKITIVERYGQRKVVARVCKDGAPFTFDGVVGLKIGDKVERQIMDGSDFGGRGDPAFLNRQPTLKEASIQGVELRLCEEVTHKLPLASCRPLNADFDGPYSADFAMINGRQQGD